MITTNFNRVAEDVHFNNHKWWFDKDGKKLERNKGEMLMLIVSEVAEAMEGKRKGLMDDHLPHRRMAEVEMADVLIRLLDYCGAYGYDLDGAFKEKMEYNKVRQDHSYAHRAKEGGKKW